MQECQSQPTGRWSILQEWQVIPAGKVVNIAGMILHNALAGGQYRRNNLRELMVSMPGMDGQDCEKAWSRCVGIYTRTGQTPFKVESFVGTEADCRQIIPRINALLGTNYDLLRFNCEHLANMAQGKQPVSKQVGGWILGATVLGLYFAFRSRND